MDINVMQNALIQMHRENQGRISASRQLQLDKHNRFSTIPRVSFTKTGFMLVQRALPADLESQFLWRHLLLVSEVRPKRV